MVVSQGVDEGPDGLRLISDIIREKLGIEMSVLMGANIANEVAEEKFCETTIGKEPRTPLSSSLHSRGVGRVKGLSVMQLKPLLPRVS